MNKRLQITEATMFELKQIRNNFNPLSQTIDIIDNGDTAIINEYFDVQKHLNRLIELVDSPRVHCHLECNSVDGLKNGQRAS